MKFGGMEQVTHAQYEVAKVDMDMPGDDEALEELGYVRSPETLQRHASYGVEVAKNLGIDMRTPAEVRRQEADDYYREEFFLTGTTPLSEAQRIRNERGLRLVRATLEERRAS